MANVLESAKQRRVLAEMGIDVWVRRGLVPPESEAVAVERSRASEAEPSPPRSDRGPVPGVAGDALQVDPAPAKPKPQTVATAEERFKLQAVSLQGVLAIVEMAVDDDLRLVSDVLKAASQFSNARPETHAFQWPQQADVTDMAAAGRAFTAFLKARTEAVKPTQLILFGARAAKLLFAEDAVPEHHLGAQVRCADDVGQLRRDPNRKRALWQAISNPSSG